MDILIFIFKCKIINVRGYRMNYKLIVKQIEIVEVNALNKEQAIKQIKNQIAQQDPRALVEIIVCEETKI